MPKIWHRSSKVAMDRAEVRQRPVRDATLLRDLAAEAGVVAQCASGGTTGCGQCGVAVVCARCCGSRGTQACADERALTVGVDVFACAQRKNGCDGEDGRSLEHSELPLFDLVTGATSPDVADTSIP